MRTKAPIFRTAQCRQLLHAQRSEPVSTPTPEGPRESEEKRDDQGPLLHEQFVASQTQGLDHQNLKPIHLALERPETSDYGIYLKRLMAIPWAAHCISCQERARPITNDD